MAIRNVNSVESRLTMPHESRHISRRQLMRTSAAALLSAGLWPGVLAAQDAAVPDVRFLCVNDLHWFDENGDAFFKTVVEKMKQAQPDGGLLLVVGDLVDKGTAAEYAGVGEVLKSTGMTVKVVAGNHDWQTQTDRKPYDEAWPNSLNYTFEHAGWQFVGLDSSDGVKFEQVSVLKPTLDWLDENLPKLDKRRPMVLYTHFPLGKDVKYQVTNADNVLNRFRDYNLRAVFNGHFHSFTERTREPYIITTNKCCSFLRNNHDGTPEKGFFLCTSKDGKFVREFVRVA